LLLELVESARAQGIDAERALRGAVRDLEGQVRQVEQASSVEA
jgi:XTP/dITP diphosphohydrolase